MQEVINCPSCRRKLQVPESLINQDVQCPSCGATFLAEVPSTSSQKRAGAKTPPPLPESIEGTAPMTDVSIDEGPRPRRRPVMVACSECGEEIRRDADKCPYCGAQQFSGRGPDRSSRRYQKAEVREFAGKKIAAGVCGILVGGLGIHKFILGLNGPGLIMLLVFLLTCGVGGVVTGIIGLVEGIIYLTKSDEEFYQTYAIEKKPWF